MAHAPTHSVPAVPPAESGVNAGALSCPACEYLLLGLPEPRCPECGRAFAWSDPDLVPANRDRLPFEKARGLRLLPAFVATWLIVIFVPWKFARQITTHAATPRALAFAAVCFASTTLSFLFGNDLPTFLAWMVSALAYVILQALVLCLMDWSGWKSPAQSFRFWLLVGCYTSAIMMTEFQSAPPLLTIRALVDFFRGASDQLPILGPGSLLNGFSGTHALSWLQILLWLGGPAACMNRRLSRAGAAPAVTLPYAAAAALLLTGLYAAVVQYIGELLYDLFD